MLRTGKNHARANARLARERSIMRDEFLVTDDDQPHVIRQSRKRPDCRWNTLAMIAGADQEEREVGSIQPQERPRLGPVRPHLGPEVIGIDSIVNDVQLAAIDRKIPTHVLGDHLRIANHGLELRAFKEPSFGVEHKTVISIGGDRNPLELATFASALLEPCPVYAISGAKYVTTLDAIVRLNDIRPVSRKRLPHGTREACVAPQTTNVEWIANDGLQAAALGRRPLARVNADRNVALEQRVDCPLEKAFRATESRITLPNDAQSHFALRNVRIARPLGEGGPRGKLNAMELGVNAVTRHQIRVCALFDDASGIEHRDAIYALDGG